ncbi:hypothetical protein PybrP1_006294 [[Pythium] brassicae (nom. inval.)]|nr:hypothetical protein PybrP1_006294 [[Pythium] brassicae (nom. inval.)]
MATPPAPYNRSTRAFSQIEAPSLLRLVPPQAASPSKTVEIRRLVSPSRSPTRAPAAPPTSPTLIAAAPTLAPPAAASTPPLTPTSVAQSADVAEKSEPKPRTEDELVRARETSEWREAASRLSERVRELEMENRLLKSSGRSPSLSLVDPPRTFAGGEMSTMLKAAEAEDALLESASGSARSAADAALLQTQSRGGNGSYGPRGTIAKSKSYAGGFGYTGLTVAEAVAASHRARSKKSRAAAAKPVDQLRAGYWNGDKNVKSSFSCNNLADMEQRDLGVEALRGKAVAGSGRASTPAALPPPVPKKLSLPPPAPPVAVPKASSTTTRGVTRGERDAAALMNSFAHKNESFVLPTSADIAQMELDSARHQQQLAIATSFRAPEAMLSHASSSFESVVDEVVDDEYDDGYDSARRRGGDGGGVSALLDRYAADRQRITSPRSLQEAGLRSTGSLMAPPPRRAGSRLADKPPPPPPQRVSSSDVRMWVGTWNMGAADPFVDGAGIIDEQRSGAMLQHLLPHGYQLYVLGVQEGVSENVYHAVEAYLNRNTHGTRYYRVELRNSLALLPNKHHPPDAVIDAVHGRGDGAFVGTKFTGLGVFVAAPAQSKVAFVRAGTHKFSVTSGSKGGVAVALRVHTTTLVFVNCHLDARNDAYRREQVRSLNASLGKVMGHHSFDLTEQFHHVVWMGDLNYRIVHLDPEMVLHMLAEGRNLELHDKFDGLLNDRRASGVFEGFAEPSKFPDFYPTYKKLPKRGFVNERQPSWPTLVYRVLYKEPFYKGGKVKKRVPGWCDRVLVHSLLVSDSKLVPEKVESPFDDGDSDADAPAEWLDNYRSVNHGHGMDVSDHSPVFATFVLSFPGLRGASHAPAAAAKLHALTATRGSRSQSTLTAPPPPPPGRQSPHGGSYFDQPKVVRHLHTVRPVSTVLIVSNMQLYWNRQTLVPKKTRIVAPLVGEEDLKQCDVIGERTTDAASHALSLSLNALVQHSRPLAHLHMLVWVKSDAVVGHCSLSLKRIARADEGGEVRFRVPLFHQSMRLFHEGHPLLLAFSLRAKTFAK